MRLLFPWNDPKQNIMSISKTFPFFAPSYRRGPSSIWFLCTSQRDCHPPPLLLFSSCTRPREGEEFFFDLTFFWTQNFSVVVSPNGLDTKLFRPKILAWALQPPLFRRSTAITLVAPISAVIYIWHEQRALQSVAVMGSTGNDVSGPLFSPFLSTIPIFPVATFSHRMSALIQNLI